MKPAERIERLIKARRYKADPETHDKALGSFLRAVDEHIEHKSAPTRPKIWRKIVNSRMTKLTAAAVIIIAGILVIYQSNGSIDIATVSFGQITENMKKMPWMHAVVEGAGESMECWACFDRKFVINKRSNGEAIHHDFLKMIVHEYDPDANTVTVSSGPLLDGSMLGNSAMDFPKMILKLFEDANDNAIQKTTGKYKEKDAKIFKISTFLGGMDMKVEMFVDAEKNILLFLNQKAFDKTGKLAIEATGHFDYPEKGPESIYDVGVPKSAKIIHSEKSEKERTAYEKAFEEAIAVIDSRKNWPEPRDLVIAYWQSRNKKNYDELAVFWPGSATWNRQALEKEEPVEYVFGEVRKTEAASIIVVPYASKDYYEKHGKYGLKMRLSNEESAKGRYYIVSGN